MYSAKINRFAAPPAMTENRTVVALAFGGQGVFELGIACEIFGLSRPEMGADWYRFAICAAEPGPLSCVGGMSMTTDTGLEAVAHAGMVIVPGWRNPLLDVPASLCEALRAAHENGARLVSLCTGAFVLAAAGVLSGRRATTHYRWVNFLAESYPDIQVVPDVLYVEDREVFTSAGGGAGIDLGLHLVNQDFGTATANQVAQLLVVQPHRAGIQPQFIQRPVARDSEGMRLGSTIDFMRENMTQKLTVRGLADRASMSVRTFARRFEEATGQTPGEWLIAERTARAKDLLETSAARIEDIASSCGFGTAANMRRHFQHSLGKNPRDFRQEKFCDISTSKSPNDGLIQLGQSVAFVKSTILAF